MNISLIISSKKNEKDTHLILSAILNNKSVDEIIFIGPRFKNKTKTYKKCNVKYINLYKRPTECIDTAIRMIKNNYFTSIPDDIVFDQSDCIDQLVLLKKSFPNIIYSTRYFINNENYTHELYLDRTLSLKDKYSNLIIPLCPILSKIDYIEAGGIDKNLFHSYWDVDLILKILKKNTDYKVKMSTLGLIENKDEKPTLYSNYGRLDKDYFYKKWFHEISNLKINKFNIMNISLNKWLFNNKLIYLILDTKLSEIIIFYINNLIYRLIRLNLRAK